jgi:hypothetical protein
VLRVVDIVVMFRRDMVMSVECVVETGRERGFNAFDCGLIQVMDWM